MTRATWQKGSKRLAGSWGYHWASDTFVVVLDSTDRVTGDKRRVVIKGADAPEWNGWRLCPTQSDPV